MKILILNYEFPPIGGGGGKVAAEIGTGLAARGHRVAVLTSHLRGLARKEVRDGLVIYRVRCGRRHAHRCTVREMAQFILGSALPAWQLARRWQPQVLHVHFGVPTGPVGWLTSRLSGAPYILTAHLGDVPGGVPAQTDHLFRFVKPLTTPIWRNASTVTAVSSHVADLCQKAYGVEAEVIVNSIDLSRIEPRNREPSLPARLLWVGRMQRQKNLPGGLGQLRHVRDLEWTLDIVGDGPERFAAEQAAREAGIETKVTFHGWLPEDQVARRMARADVLFMPSDSEGLSMVALQALALGLAIVGSRVEGLMEVVVDGVNGMLCSPEEPQSFAAAVRRLVENPQLLSAMQLASQELAGQFSLERAIDRYETALQRAVNEDARI